MSGNENYRPGGIVLENLSLTNFDGSKSEDIRNFVGELNIYEDIFQSQIMGDVTINDTKELIEFFPIVGEETLEIRFRVPGRPVDSSIDFKKMRVYKIGDRATYGEDLGKVQSYKLYFFSPELITNLNSSVSRSFNTKTVGDIVKTLFDDYLDSDKKIDVEETEGTLKTIIPSWNPFKAINWLASNRAINKTGDADFLFFESSDKVNGPKYNFKSIETMMGQSPTFDIEFKVQNTYVDGKKDTSTIHKSVDSFSFDNNGDVLNNTMSGQYNQTWIYHDPLRKKFVVSKQEHEEDYMGDSTDKKFYSDTVKKQSKPLQCIRMPGGVDSFPANISSSKSIDNDTAKGAETRPNRKDIKYIDKREKKDELECTSMIINHGPMRIFKIQQMNNFNLCIEAIPGTDDIQLGKTVFFNKPHITFDSQLVSNKSGRFDDRFVSGNYLVTRLKHRIYIKENSNEMSYEMALELVKDTFNEEISHKDIKGL